MKNCLQEFNNSVQPVNTDFRSKTFTGLVPVSAPLHTAFGYGEKKLTDSGKK